MNNGLVAASLMQEVILLLVPTTQLAQQVVNDCNECGLEVARLSDSSDAAIVKNAFTTPTSTGRIVVGSPEFLAIHHAVIPSSLRFVVVDECHLLLSWP